MDGHDDKVSAEELSTETTMLRIFRVSLTVSLAAILFSSIAIADEPKEVKTEKGKAIVLGNMASQPASCSSGPGPIPLPQLKVKPAHGDVFLQTAVSDLAATDSCPARKIPTIVIVYAPKPDFVGVDAVLIEFEASGKKLPTVNLRIKVEDIAGK
jgi:hypothetical protein